MDAKGVQPNALARKLVAVAAGTEVPFRVVLSNGTVIEKGGASPAFIMTFRTWGAELRTIAFGYVGLLESYLAGGIDIDGEIALAFRAGFDSGYDRVPNALAQLRNRWHEWRFSNRSTKQAKANARYHYGLGEAFYRYWPYTVGMMYTCAYWPEGTATLEHVERPLSLPLCACVSQGHDACTYACRHARTRTPPSVFASLPQSEERQESDDDDDGTDNIDDSVHEHFLRVEGVRIACKPTRAIANDPLLRPDPLCDSAQTIPRRFSNIYPWVSLAHWRVHSSPRNAVLAIEQATQVSKKCAATY